MVFAQQRGWLNYSTEIIDKTIFFYPNAKVLSTEIPLLAGGRRR